MKVTEKEVESVSKLEPFKRYQYFIKRVADSEVMYSLQSIVGNWALSEVDGNLLFSLWSAKEFAIQHLVDEWKEYKIKEISFDAFEDELKSLVKDEKYLLNIFPTGQKTGFIVTLDEFVRDLSEELKKYE
jgi:hypothetical protein